MDVDGFLAELPSLFGDFPHSGVPLDRGLLRVCEQIDGLSEENNLALLAAAARHLEHDECYLEAGAYHGRSLVGVAVGSSAPCLAIDDFSYEDASRDRLGQNLARFDVQGRVEVIGADTVQTLSRMALPPVGVFFYDADHSTEATRGALEAVRGHLTPHALIVVDDADWDTVRAAVDDFLAGNPNAALRLRIPGRALDQPWWWDGMDLIEWTESRRDE